MYCFFLKSLKRCKCGRIITHNRCVASLEPYSRKVRNNFLLDRDFSTNYESKTCEKFIEKCQETWKCAEPNSSQNSSEELDNLTNVHIQKQNEFLNKFEENENEEGSHSRVQIFSKYNTNQEFLLNNENYQDFINRYNEEKNKNKKKIEKKGSRFSQAHLPIEEDERSLWEILKEQEEEKKKKKKVKKYQKELESKMEKEYEKIQKEERFLQSFKDDDSSKNSMKTENMSKTVKNHQVENNPKYGSKKLINHYKRKELLESADDIDTFLMNENKYANEIKSYDEIYEKSLEKDNCTSKKGDSLNERSKIEPSDEEEEEDMNISQIIHEDFRNQVDYDGMERYKRRGTGNFMKDKGENNTSYRSMYDNETDRRSFSNILHNDLHEKSSSDYVHNYKEQLFVEEKDSLSAKHCIAELMENKNHEKSTEHVEWTPDKTFRENELLNGKIKNKEKEICKRVDDSSLIEVTPEEAISRVSGFSMTSIVDSNIDNLIIQREIKKENHVNGVLRVLYNNLDSCDAINLSTGFLKISKLADSYQKQSISNNEFYKHIVKKIEEQLNIFELSSLVQLFYAFVKIRHLPFFFNDLIVNLHRKIDKAEPKQLCSIMYTLSNIMIESNESRILKDKVIEQVTSNFNEFTNLNDLICLLTSLSKMKYKEIHMYYELSKKIEMHIDELTIKNVSNILWAFSNVHYTCKLVKQTKKIIEKNIHDSSCGDLVNIIYSLTKLNEFDDHLYNEVFYNAINVYLHNMNLKNLCVILWCYTYANIEKPELIINVLTKVNENIKYITSKDVVSILSCLTKIKHPLRYKHLLDHLKSKVLKNLYAYTPLQLTNIIYHSSFLDIYDHKYYFLLVQQIYQIRKLLYIENWVLILYALKNVCYLNLYHREVFHLVHYILIQIKKKYRLLHGEDCVQILLVLNELKPYTYHGYLDFSHLENIRRDEIEPHCNQSIDSTVSIDNNTLEEVKKEKEGTVEKKGNYVDIFNENVTLEQINMLEEEELYLPMINDLLYEQIKIRLSNFWQLTIKDVNNLLLVMRQDSMYDDVIINMILRQIIPILMKSTNIEFLVFLSNISSNRNVKFIALTHLSRRPKLISVFRKKINSIVQSIMNHQCDEEIFTEVPEEEDRMNPSKNEKTGTIDFISNKTNQTFLNGIVKKNKVDLSSCIALAYACFQINYEDENIIKLYDLIEHMIMEERKAISTYMLINYLYILTLSNNKIPLVQTLIKEYMEYRYTSNFERGRVYTKEIERIYDETNQPIKESRLHSTNLSVNLIYEPNDPLACYISNGDESSSLLLLKLLYINILCNEYKYLYHILCEISKYNEQAYSYEFVSLSKQVCYHIYNFTNFFSKDKQQNYLRNKVNENIYVNDEDMYVEVPFEKSNVNLLKQQDSPELINPVLTNKHISKSIENNIQIAKYFYYILNYNDEDIRDRNLNNVVSRKEKKKLKIFHFDHIIGDILNFLNIQYKGIHTYENIYKICCSFPYERHLIDLLSYEDVLFPSNKILVSSELRQKHLALKGWTVHSINFRDVYNSIKDKNIICYIFSICKKIKKNLNHVEDKEQMMNEKNFWENIKYADMI